MHDIEQVIDWNAVKDIVHVDGNVHRIHWRVRDAKCTVGTAVCSGGMEGR